MQDDGYKESVEDKPVRIRPRRLSRGRKSSVKLHREGLISFQQVQIGVTARKRRRLALLSISPTMCRMRSEYVSNGVFGSRMVGFTPCTDEGFKVSAIGQKMIARLQQFVDNLEEQAGRNNWIDSYVGRDPQGSPEMLVMHEHYGVKSTFSIKELEAILARLKSMEEQDALELPHEQERS